MNMISRFFEKIAHPVMLINHDCLMSCNSASLRELGYPAQETFTELCISDISPALQTDGRCSKEKMTALMALASEQGQYHFNWQHQRYNGEVFNVGMTLTATEIENDSILHVAWSKSTDKKKQALQDAIFNSQCFSSIATDVHGVIQIFNVGAETMLGFKASEVVNIMTPADLSDIFELSTRANDLSQEFGKIIEPGFEALIYKAALGIEDIYKLTYICKDGHCLPAQVSVTALRDEDQIIIGYLLIGTDNTERELLAQKLKAASTLQDAIFNSHTFSSIATDVHGVIQIFNVGAETMLGFKASEVVNIMTPADLSDTLELSTRALTLSQEFGQPISSGFEALIYKAALGIEDIYELTYVCKDGQRLPAQVSVTALHDEDQSIIGYLLIGTDNTARKQIEKDMQVASVAFESAQSMYITDTHGCFLNINQAFTETTGYSLSDVLGKHASLLNSEQHNNESYQAKWEILLSTGTWSGELWNKKKNGELILELVTIVSVKDSKNHTTHYVVNCSDISQRIAYETGLIEAKDKAERFSTLKSQFIASMSHEIRTPMTAIIGFSQLALEDEMPEETKQYVEYIYTASTSLLGILQDVLDFTKLEAGRVIIESIPFNLLDLLSTIDILFSGASKQKGLSLSITRDPMAPLDLFGDKLRIQQVLTNLVGNAIKFTAQGEIRLDIRAQEISLSQVQLLFSITDTGIGIASEDISKLFVEFSQVDGTFTRKYGGTGLGLVISKELVELMGGEISVESVKDQGTTFSFSLQFNINSTRKIITINSASNSPTQLSPPISHTFKGYLALIVEDNDSLRRVISKQLLKLGMASIITNDGAEALSMLEQHDFDVVLIDIHMPVMNGIEATKLIRSQEKYAHLPIIALTAGVTEIERNNCVACGMDDFIEKPINRDQLCEILKLHLKTKV